MWGAGAFKVISESKALGKASLNSTSLKALLLRLLSFDGTRTVRRSSANWLAGRVYWVVRGLRVGNASRARPIRRHVVRVTLTGFAGWADWLSRSACGSSTGWGSLCLRCKAKHTRNNQCR
jgi:hypothetical protein